MIVADSIGLSGGVYRLTHVPSGRHYVGQSHCVLRRVADHAKQLASGSHLNLGMQHWWRRTKPEEWRADLIHECEDYWRRLHLERQEIACTIGTASCFNILVGIVPKEDLSLDAEQDREDGSRLRFLLKHPELQVQSPIPVHTNPIKVGDSARIIGGPYRDSHVVVHKIGKKQVAVKLGKRIIWLDAALLR